MEGFHIPLRDGDQAWVRPIRPSDKSAIEAAFTLLSDQSIYDRFLLPLNELNPRMLSYFTEVDQVDHVAWGIEMPDKPEIPGIAVGRYVRLEKEPNVAEFALTVIDQYQGKGLGTFMLALLYRLAQRQGDIGILRGVIGNDNQKMLSWMRLLGADLYLSEDYLMHADLAVVPGQPQMPQNRAAGRFCKILSLIQAGEDAHEMAQNGASPSEN